MRQALLVIDVQNEYFTGKMPVVYPFGSLEKILQAMDTAHEHKIPIVVIQHSATQSNAAIFVKNSNGWKLHPEIIKRKYSVLIEKHLPGSFSGTNLDGWLKENGISSVTIVGYMTQMCCDTTARQAMHLGYVVNFLSDATGTLDINNEAGFVRAEDLHKTILAVQNSRFSKVINTKTWSRELLID